MIGTVVRHERFGRGRVTGVARVGMELRVFFFDLGITLPVSRLSVELEGPAPPEREKRAGGSARGKGDVAARRLVEAIRMGVVPCDRVREFTCGRERERRTLQNWLNREDGGAIVIQGEYGTGKTHLLEYLARLGEEAGWAVMRCVLDPEESPPHNPFRVYRALVQNCRGPDGIDFRGLLEGLAGRGVLQDHPYFGPALRGLDRPGVFEWIRGDVQGANPFGVALHDHTTAANIYCNLLTALSWACRNVLRWPGLLVLLDEAESVTAPWLYLYQRERGPLFLEGLIRSARGEAALAGERVARRGNSSSEPYRGVRSGLLYSGHVRLPYVYRRPTHLKVALALTPMGRMEGRLKPSGGTVVELHPLTEFVLWEGFERLISLYRDAYPGYRPWNFERERIFQRILHLNRLGRNTRNFFKAVVEALDLHRHGLWDTKA